MSQFDGQFLLHRGNATVPDDFVQTELTNGFQLAASVDLPLITVGVDGHTVGYLLGHPIDLRSGTLLASGDCLDLGATAATSLVEALYDSCSGSFIFIHLSADDLEIYLDACGSLSLVYEPETQRAGATALLLLGDQYDTRFRAELFKAFEVAGDGWFSAGLTAHTGLWRLLPNHRLSMKAMATTRHWPLAMPPYSTDPDTLIRQIGNEVAQVTRAAQAGMPLAMALTGGFETRALLACCRELAHEIRFATVELPRSRRDVVLAQRIARFAGLDHTILPCRTASAHQAEDWSRMAGHCLTGANRIYFPSVEPLVGNVLIGGLGGEVGRGFLWPGEMPDLGQIDVLFLIDQLKLTRHPLLLSHIGLWLEQLPVGLDSYQLLDLAYVELRMGPWAFAQSYTNFTKIDLHPLISRRQFTAMWSLPPALRRESGLMRNLIAQFWPELGAVPINAYGDWRDVAAPFVRTIREPWRAYRKLRQIVRRMWANVFQ